MSESYEGEAYGGINASPQQNDHGETFMQSRIHTDHISKTWAGYQQVGRTSIWAGRILSGLVSLFLLLDGAMKLPKPAVVVDATVRLGYSESVIVPLGFTLLACTILYLIPRTVVLGAILLTGYLGGAVASHVRVSDGWFPIIFPFILGLLIWGGLYLRNERLRALIPLRR